MKKFLALILTLALVMSMSVAAFANTDDLDVVNNNTSTGTVKVTTTATQDTVYCVTVTWGTLQFNYTFGNGVWNPQKHEYDQGAGAGWYIGNDVANANSEIGSTIVIENHSNAEVTFEALFGTETSVTKSGVTATLLENTGTLVSADDDDFRKAANVQNDGDYVWDGDYKTIRLTVSGKPETVVTDLPIGTITVTISAVPAQQPQP